MEKTTQFDGYVSEIEKNTNKVTTINESSTDDQYPSAKAVYNTVKNSYNDENFVNTFASVIKNTVSGSAIAIKDISSIEHNLDISVTKLGKNLIPPSIYDGIDFKTYSTINTDEYIQLTSNDNGTLNVKCTDTMAVLSSAKTTKTFTLPAGTYTFSTSYNDFGIVTLMKGSSTIGNLRPDTTSLTFTLSEVATLSIRFGFTGATYEGIIKPQIEQGSEATEFEEYSIKQAENVTVKEYGKNLLDYKLVEKTNYSTPTLIDNGFRAVGKYYCQIKSIPVVKNTVYNLSYITNILEGSTKTIVIFGNDSTANKITTFTNGTGGSFNSGNYDTILIAFYSGSSTSGTVEFTNLQLELGSLSDYEPYITPITAVSDSNGKVSGLKSIYPTTTLISSDENVTITCKYNADTKAYIDNKFLELQSAMVSAINDTESELLDEG